MDKSFTLLRWHHVHKRGLYAAIYLSIYLSIYKFTAHQPTITSLRTSATATVRFVQLESKCFSLRRFLQHFRLRPRHSTNILIKAIKVSCVYLHNITEPLSVHILLHVSPVSRLLGLRVEVIFARF